MQTAASPVSAEMPLLMTAYEDSYHSYTASLADVDARLSDLAAREETVRCRIESANQTYRELEAEMQEQKTAFEDHLRLTRQRQTELQEKRVALQRRQDRLAVFATQRQALAVEDEAAAAQEAYWSELLQSHQHALEALTRRRRGGRGVSGENSTGGNTPRPFTPPPRRAGQGVDSLHATRRTGMVPRPPSPKPAVDGEEGEDTKMGSAVIATSSPQNSPAPPLTSLHACWPDAVAAVRAGHAAALAALLRRCPELVQCTEAAGNTLLHLACASEPPSLPVVRCLLRCGAPCDLYNAAGLAPLHVACLNLQDLTHCVADAVVEAGAEVNQRTTSGETAAHLLASHDAFLPSLEHFIDRHHADLSVRAEVAGEMRTPLEVAEFYDGPQTAGVRDLLRMVSPQ